MTPPNLQGLNLVQPEQPQHNPYISDADLLSQLPPFSDFNAQLDLWTNLSFHTDEPILPTKEHERVLDAGKLGGEDVDNDEEEYSNAGEVAPANAHDNVVTPTNLTSPTTHNNAGNATPNAAPSLDLGALLAGFGLHQPAPALPSGDASSVPSLAQLLSLYAGQSAPGSFPPPQQPAEHPATQPSYTVTGSTQSTAKRPRTRKTSVSASQAGSPEASADSPDVSGQGLSAAEDKRRRNTAASARFRLKKKEREQALEKKAKELEVRVTELERVCEGLRRENGWLKGLVVGVTGAQQQKQTQSSGAGSKRSREEASLSTEEDS